MRRSFSRLLGMVLLAVTPVLPGCGKDQPAAPAAPKPVSDHFPVKVGGKIVQMQLAVTQDEQERGLMERRDLGRDEGMLFVYTTPQQMHFWMHNTPTPLDIGFFDRNGVLLEVRAMQPYDETTISSQTARVQFPLEMHQGWFRSNGLAPGAQLDLAAVAAGLKARGFNPASFGMRP